MSAAAGTKKRPSTGGSSSSSSSQRPEKKPKTKNTPTTTLNETTSITTPNTQINSTGLEEEVDPVWSTVYNPLPSTHQLATDYSQSQKHASSHTANAASVVGAAPDSYVPALIASLVPSSQFEINFNSKLKDKNLMLDNSLSGKSHNNLGESALKLEKKRRKKRGIKMMSSNQRKAAGLTQIPKKNIKYSMFLPLHHLWIAYMHDILDPQNSRGLSTGERIIKADFHGAIFTVIRCRSPSHIGLRGIMIQETQETFQIVTPNNALKVIPKRHAIFSFTVPEINPAAESFSLPSSTDPSAIGDDLTDKSASSPTTSSSSPLQPHVFELYGDHLCFRSYERSSRKFKAKATIQL